jgi:hypothetical protein
MEAALSFKTRVTISQSPRSNTPKSLNQKKKRSSDYVGCKVKSSVKVNTVKAYI